MDRKWLTSEILGWRVNAQGFTLPSENLWKRAYEIWNHAEQVLSRPTSEFLRVDVIATLRRAIDNRVRLLNSLYSFRSIPIKEKPSEILSMLEFAGVIRPLMLQKLIDIRNAVEHEDASPPNIEACQVFLEFTWYFLRSTDRLAQQVLRDFSLRPLDEDEDYYWMEVNSGPDNDWLPKLRGWLPASMLSDEPKSSWLVLQVEKIETRADAAERLKDSPSSILEGDSGRGKNPDDVYLFAEVRGPSDALISLLKMYFEAI